MNNWDLKTLCGDVKYQVVSSDGPIQSIRFEHEPYLGQATEVFAYLGMPVVNDGAVPGMVCVHGGGGQAFKQWVELWVARGYAAIAMDLSGRDGQGQRLPHGGPEQDDPTKFSTSAAWEDRWTYHAVAAAIRANSILHNLPAVDPARIGITGISWGGYVTCIAAGVDPRFACAIPVYGCGFLQHNSADVWMTIFKEMTPAQRQAWHEKCDPSVYLRHATTPMLFVSGTNDFAYPLDSLEMSCALPAGPVSRCIRLEMPHGHEAGWAPAEISLFAGQQLRQGAPLPALGPCLAVAQGVRAAYTSCHPIAKGLLLYTTGRGKWQDRKWHSLPATVTEGAVACAVPEDAAVCFLAIEDARGAYVSSPYLRIADRGSA